MVAPTTAQPPPHDLDLVIDFVNTLDIERGSDELAEPRALGAWLRERKLLRRRAGPDAGEHRQALELREALRTLMLAHNGDAGASRAGRTLERVAREGALGVHFGEDGALALAAADGGYGGALARLLVPVAHAIEDGSWERVKACRAPDCTWAFYDRSRNRSGVWCEMAVCGNRTKVRAYRDRHP